MGIRSNNSAQSFFDIFTGTGSRASGASAPGVEAAPFTAKIVLVGGGGGGGIGQGAGAGNTSFSDNVNKALESIKTNP